MNEVADKMAKAELSSPDVVGIPNLAQEMLWVVSQGLDKRLSKVALFKVFQDWYHHHQQRVWATTAGVTATHLFTEGLGQQYSKKANSHLALGNK